MGGSVRPDQASDDPVAAYLAKYGKPKGPSAPASPTPAPSATPDASDAVAAYLQTYGGAHGQRTLGDTGNIDLRGPAGPATPPAPVRMPPAVVMAERPPVRLAPVVITAQRPAPLVPPVVAPSDATRLVPTPNPQAIQLAGLGKKASDIFQAMADNPVTTATAIPLAPIVSAFQFGRYIGQDINKVVKQGGASTTEALDVPDVTHREGGIAAAQLAALGLGGVARTAIGVGTARALTKAGAPAVVARGVGGTVGAAAEGAGVGAAYDPEHPARGAAIGSVLSVLGNEVGAAAARRARGPIPPAEAPVAPTERRLTGRTTGKGTARVVEEPPTGPAEPDVTFQDNPIPADAPPAVRQYLERFGARPVEPAATAAAESPATGARATEGAAPKPTLRRRMAETIDPNLVEERRATEEHVRKLDEERRSLQRQLETDKLTGLGNRDALDKALPAAEASPAMGVAAFDANNFGKVNKLAGHAVGDQYIKDIAGSLQRAADDEGGAQIFRRGTGGDEFVVIAPHEKLARIVQRAEEFFGERVVGEGDQRTVVSLTGTHGTTFAEADAQLQAAKNARKAAQAARATQPTEVPTQPPAQQPTSAWKPAQELGRGRPGVTIEDVEGGKVAVARNADGVPQGYLTLEEIEPGNYRAQEVEVDPAARRQGVATSLYRAVASQGHRIVSGGFGLSAEGRALVNRLHEQGVVDRVETTAPVPAPASEGVAAPTASAQAEAPAEATLHERAVEQQRAYLDARQRVQQAAREFDEALRTHDDAAADAAEARRRAAVQEMESARAARTATTAEIERVHGTAARGRVSDTLINMHEQRPTPPRPQKLAKPEPKPTASADDVDLADSFIEDDGESALAQRENGNENLGEDSGEPSAKTLNKPALPAKEAAVAAGRFGAAAFARGATRIPAQDPGFTTFLAANAKQPGEATPLLDAWLKAWDQANLTKPVGGTRPEATSIASATTGRPFRATLMRGQGAEASPYNPLGAQVPILGKGRYGTTDRSYAETFGPHITTHTAELSNPLVIDSDQQWRALTQRAGWEFPNPFGLDPKVVEAGITRLRQQIEAAGYDGVVVRIPADERTGKTLGNVFGADQVVEFKPSAAPAPAAQEPAPTKKKLIPTRTNVEGTTAPTEAPTPKSKYAQALIKDLDASGAPVPAKFDTPEIRALRERAAAIQPPADTPERQAWRVAQARSLAEGASRFERRADLVLGLPGAGKTSTATDPLVEANGAVLLDADRPKENDPSGIYQNGLGAGALHAESAAIRLAALEQVIPTGANLVYPTIGHATDTPTLIKALQRHGYTVHVHLVDVPPDVAAQRAVERFQKSVGHFVDPAHIFRRGEDPRRGFAAAADLPGVIAHAPLDNTVPHGTAPRPIEDWRERFGLDAVAGDTRPAAASDAGAGRPGRGSGGRRDVAPSADAATEAPAATDVTASEAPNANTTRSVRPGVSGQPEGASPRGVRPGEAGGDVGPGRQGGAGASRGEGAGGVRRAPGAASEPEGLRESGATPDDARVAGEGAGDGRSGRPARGEGATPAQRVERQATRAPAQANYELTPGKAATILEGGAVSKAKANVAAIRLLKEIEAAGRPATIAEQDILSRYTGWGGMPQAFDETHKGYASVEGPALRALLTQAEWEAARASTPNAHYTSPEVIAGVHRLLGHLGFTGGRILEPSMGAGYFLGMTPEAVRSAFRWTGVELDSVTGRIAKLLYPAADVHVMGFQELQRPDGFFDMAVGNVPFGNYKVHDPRYNALKLSIHNYFFRKSLDLVRPGGMVAYITSAFTLDAQSTVVRKELAKLADLVGAIRLPGDAFKGIANTDVTTDLIVLKKRAPGEAPAGEAWATTVPTEVEGKDGKRVTINLNEYFAAHPEHILGELRGDGTMNARFGDAAEMRVKSTGPLGPQLDAAIQRFPAGAYRAAEVTSPASKAPGDLPIAEPTLAPDDVRDYGLTVGEGGKILQRRAGVLVDAGVPKSATERVTKLIQLRDLTKAALNAQIEDRPEAEIERTRKALDKAYTAFVRKYGPILKETRTETKRLNPTTGEPVVQVRTPNLRHFTDGEKALVLALEHYDPESGTAEKGDILVRRVYEPRKAVARVDTPNDALPVVLAEAGRVDLQRIAQLSGVTPEDAAQALRGLIFEDHTAPGTWKHVDEYTTGDVKTKLAELAPLAKADPARWGENLKALEAAIPEDLPPSKISARLGAPWIPTSDIERFAIELLGAGPVTVSYTPAGNIGWRVEGGWQAKMTPANTTEFGTRDRNALDLIETALNLKTPTVYDPPDRDGKRAKNAEKTLAAQEKMQRIQDRFERWVWEDGARADRLARLYNDRFNRIRNARYDGSHLTLPGSAAFVKGRPFALRPHQKNAVWRIITDGNTLLAHVVGSGKTFTMIAAGMEQKRLGLVRKPLYVVPNHMLDQFSTEFKQLYPAADLLLATEDDFAKAERQAFVARAATNNWDAIIMTHRSFESVPMSDAFQEQFIRQQLMELEEAIREAKKAKSERALVKQIEKAKFNLEAKLEKMMAEGKKDQLLSFEQMGVDQVFVDEADVYKNLMFSTKLEGVSAPSSERAFDLFLKSMHLEQVNPGRGLVFATGTPIANAVAEMFTMQRYLQPKALGERGLSGFDAWAATFGKTVTGLEMKPDNSGFRLKTRFASYDNVGELAQMFRSVTDVQTAEDLDLPRPKLKGGAMQLNKAPASGPLRAYVKQLAKRGEAVQQRRVAPEEDNWLKITGDGRSAALDMRLVDANALDLPDSKVNLAVDTIHELWERTKDVRGAQLVFSDLSTPGSDPGPHGGVPHFNVYDDIKRKLVAKGVPAKEVRFIHDAKTDEAKKKLFADVRAGRVRVLLGSTEKMGAGTNVQDRLVALHNLDAPWRPRDIEQRHGRILRQGNVLYDTGKIPHVEIHTYVTEGSFDGYIWQSLERKAAFIKQALTADADTRSIEDVGDVEIDWATAKAIASGNPMVKDKAEVDAKLGRLERLERAHRDEQFGVRRELQSLPAKIDGYEREATATAKDAKALVPTTGDQFTITVHGATLTKRADAGAALQAAVQKAAAEILTMDRGTEKETRLGRFAGLDLSIVARRTHLSSVPEVHFRLHGAGDHYRELGENDSPASLVAQLEAMPHAIAKRADVLKEHLAAARQRLATMREKGEQPFQHAEELTTLRAKQKDLDAALSASSAAETASDEQLATMLREAEAQGHTSAAGLIKDVIAQRAKAKDTPLADDSGFGEDDAGVVGAPMLSPAGNAPSPRRLRRPGSASTTVAEDAADVTDTPAFRRWFGNSKVVDEDGNPLVMYHGTGTSTDVFEGGKGRRPGLHSEGIWFTKTPDGTDFSASAFAEGAFRGNPQVYPVYLSIQNPKRIGNSQAHTWTVKELKEMGYDGAFDIETEWWIAFDSSQIKSAIANRGTFDPNEPSILLSPASGGTTKRRSGAASGQRSGQGARASAGPSAPSDAKVKSLAEIARQLASLVDVPLRQGRFLARARRAAGAYFPQKEVARVLRFDRLETVAHEIGHYLSHKYLGQPTRLGAARRGAPPMSPAVKREFTALGKALYGSRKPKGGYGEEGIAEWAKLYVTDPERLAVEAPNAAQWVHDHLLAKEPALKAAMDQARQDFADYQAAPADARVDAMIDVAPSRRFLPDPRTLPTHYIDDLYEVRRAMDELGSAVSPARNAYLLSRLTRGGAGLAEEMVLRGVIDPKTGERVTKGVAEVLAQLPKRDVQRFRRYLVAERTIEVAGRGIDTGISVADARTLVDKYGARFRPLAEDLWAISNALIDYRVTKGLLTPEEGRTIKQKNRRRVGFYRVFADDETAASRGHGRGFGRNSSGVLAMKGSARKIIDPLESMITDVYRTVQQSHAADVLQALVEQADRTPGGGRVIEILTEAPKRPVRIRVDDVKEQLAELGVELPDAGLGDMPGVLTAFETLSQAGPKEQKDLVRPLVIKGQRKWIQIKDAPLYNALAGLGTPQMTALMRFLSIPTRTLRAGATLTLEFVARNPVRDAWSAAIYSRAGTRPPGWDLARGLFHVLKQDQMYQDWRLDGGDNAAMLALDRVDVKKHVKQLMRSKPEVLRDWVIHPIDTLRLLSSLTENATRVGEYVGVRRKLEGQGMAPEDARVAASLASRDVTIDFARSGDYMRAVNQIIAFSNANAQGWDKLYRELKQNPQTVIPRLLAFITIPSLLLYLWQKDDPAYQEVPRWQKIMAWVIVDRDDQGNVKHIWRIPKPPDLGILFGSVPELIAQYANDHNGGTALKGALEALSNLNPVHIPNALGPLVEWWANKSFFTDHAIVPEGLANLPAAEQSTDRTGELARQIGQPLHLSPAKIENTVRGYTGGLGTYGMDLGNVFLREGREALGLPALKPPASQMRVLNDGPASVPLIKGFAVRTPQMDAQSIQDALDAYQSADAHRQAWKHKLSQGDAAGARGYFAKHEAAIRSVATAADRLGAVGVLKDAHDLIVDAQRIVKDADPETRAWAADAAMKAARAALKGERVSREERRELHRDAARAALMGRRRLRRGMREARAAPTTGTTP